MTIWLWTALILLVAIAAALFPMLRGKSAWQPLALALVFAGAAGGLYLYQQIGTPSAIGPSMVSRD